MIGREKIVWLQGSLEFINILPPSGPLVLSKIFLYSSPVLIRQPLLQWKSGLIRGVSSLEGDN